ncbi:MAG: adenine phosphoribosyltransferase [Candidatus Omnitrophica bacterium]|nr:adenine phosphoribosyltransferase [Candidatus Omnitrophota bacterium]MDD5653362.1 adenine phosphoribosyltransferase [Candidatus Omnitrophota bacterium]
MIAEIDLKKCIRDIADFPKPGILFKDITTLLKDGKAFAQTVDALAQKYKNEKIDKVLAIEARGFIFGAAVAYKLGAGFIPVRKKGKLPAKTTSVTYSLEYGTDTLQMHEDAIKSGENILIVDDLLATGGTANAVAGLVKKMGGKIAGIAFLIELVDLKGIEKLKEYPVYSLIKC